MPFIHPKRVCIRICRCKHVHSCFHGVCTGVYCFTKSAWRVQVCVLYVTCTQLSSLSDRDVACASQCVYVERTGRIPYAAMQIAHAAVCECHPHLCIKGRSVWRQVESEVKEVNNQFARLRGMPNAAHSLDLYGRSFSMAPVPKASCPNTRVRRSGRTSQGPRLKSAPPPPLLSPLPLTLTSALTVSVQSTSNHSCGICSHLSTGRSQVNGSRVNALAMLCLHVRHGQCYSCCLGTKHVAAIGSLELQTPLHDAGCACSLKHVKMATMTRQQSTLLHEEQAGDFLRRRGSDQNLVCSFHHWYHCSSHQATNSMQRVVLLDHLA